LPPLSIDEIRKGRRRDWDKLKDPEEAKRAKQAEREANRADHKKSLSTIRKREMTREEEREHDKEHWEKTKRDLKRWGIVAGASLLVWFSLSWGWSAWRRGERDRKLDRVMVLVDRGETYTALKDPIDAFASWRSSWRRGDAAALYRMYSFDRQVKYRGRLADRDYVSNLQSRVSRGQMDGEKSIAVQFGEPEIMLWPSTPWRDKRLTVFKSAPISRTGVKEKPEPWVVAFSYDARMDEWRLEDVRKAAQWKDRWESAAQISNLTAVSHQNNSRYLD